MHNPVLTLPPDSRVFRVAPWVAEEECQQAIATFATRLGEPERRWLGGVLATMIGHGGIGVAAHLVELCPDTVSRGKSELANGLNDCPWGRDRVEGAGRPPIEALRPEIEDILKELAEPHLYGDPESGRTYCRRSTRKLAKDLTERDFPVGRDTVRRLLKKGGIHCAPTSSGSPARRTRTATCSSK